MDKEANKCSRMSVARAHSTAEATAAAAAAEAAAAPTTECPDSALPPAHPCSLSHCSRLSLYSSVAQMQALHAAFGVGAFFAPLIMSPFLGGEALYVDPLTQVDSGAGSGGVNGTAVVPQTTTIVQASGSTTYHYAYFLICLLNLPVVLSLGYYSLRDEITVAQVIALVKRACCGRWSRGSGGSWDRVGSGAEDSGSGAGYADEQNDLSHQHHHSGSASSEFGLASPSNLHGSGNGHSGVEMSIVLSHEGGDDDEAALELGSGQAHGDGGADAVFRPPEEDSPDAHHTATGRRDSSALLLANGGVGAMHVIMPHTHEANGHGHSSHDHHHLHVHDLASPGSGTTVSSSPPASAALMISASPTALSPEPSPSPSEDAADADSAAAAASSPRTFRENLSACCTALSDPKWKLVLLVSLFLFLYVGCESGYAAYIFSYGVQALGMAPASAAFLNATFWFAFAVGRLAAIPLSLRFSSTQLIFTDLAGCILCVLAMIIFHDSLALLWVGTILYGLSVASIYPSAINYAESQIEMSGRVLSLMTVSASLGDAIVPLLMGLSFESPTGPLGLMLIAAGVAVGAAVIFAIIVGCVAPAAGGKRGGQADEAEEARARKRRERSRKKRRAAAVAAVAAAQAAAAGHEHSVDPASEFASDAASSSSLPPQPHRDRAPSPTPKPKRSQYASLETSDESERAESASSSVAGPPSPSASSSRFSSSSAAAAAGSHSPTDRLADVPLQSPIKVSLRQHAEEDDDLPEL